MAHLARRDSHWLRARHLGCDCLPLGSLAWLSRDLEWTGLWVHFARLLAKVLTIHSRGTKIVPILLPLTQALGIQMRASIIAILTCGALAGCDGGFRYKGTVSSSRNMPLQNCLVTLREVDSEEVLQFEHFSPPVFSGGFVVAPTDQIYTLTVTCKSHFSKRLIVPYGTDVPVSATKDFGNVVLVPIGG
jgi:hypothetical protein